MSVMAGVNDAAVISIRDKLRGKIGQTKVKRYRTGKAPEWPDHDHDHAPVTLEEEHAAETTINIDPRLRRLAESKIDNRQVIRADIEGLDLEDQQDEDALEDRRRRRIREKFLQCQQQQDQEESEYGTDSEKELTCIVMVKPVFVPIFERDTIAERERLEAEEQALEDMMRRLLEERKVETKQIVVAEIRKDEEIHQNLEMEANIADVDTDDEVNEYEAWKVREIARIKKDRDIARELATLKEKEEIDKVRNMTKEESREWKKNSKPLSGSKRKWQGIHAQVLLHA